MRLLVLGKTGQIGWELQRALSPVGDVVALGRDIADFENATQLRATVADVSPDVIINATAYTSVDKAESESKLADRINHLAVGELGEMVASRGGSLIHYSTDYVFDGSKPGQYLEADDTAPQNVYGRSKRDGERALLATGANCIILRTSWIHAGRGNNFVQTILRLAAERDELHIVADQFGAPTGAELVADVTAHALMGMAHGSPLPGGVYHLSAAGETSWHGLAQFVVAEADRLGVTLRVTHERILPINTTDYPTPAVRPANSRLNTRKLCEALGITLPDWRLHVRRSVAQILEGRSK